MNDISSLNMLDKLQDAAIADYQKKQQENKKHTYSFDTLKMYFGDTYEVKGIKMYMPTIGDIIEIGEKRFYQSLSPFVSNSTSIRVMLWEYFKKDWNKVKDIEVYDLLSQVIQDKEPLNLIFKEKKFDDFQLIQIKTSQSDEEDVQKTLGLYSKSKDILLTEDDYMNIAEYIREMLGIHPKKEKIKGKSAILWTIQEDKMNQQIDNKEETVKSNLSTLISACINHPGFKYKLQELRNIGIYQFMDSVKRIQKYEVANAAIKGVYSGFVDGKSMPENTLNFMGDL